MFRLAVSFLILSAVVLPAGLCAMSGCGGRAGDATRAADDRAASVPVEPSPLLAEATTGISNPALAALLREHWEWWMKSQPTWATTLGDRRYDDRIPDRSPAGLERERATER
ncbi:MAG: hypothetical protein AAGC55_05255, partial [Myxococcota bacterium]